MSQATIDRWEDKTPKGIPKRLKKHASFISAFSDELNRLGVSHDA